MDNIKDKPESSRSEKPDFDKSVRDLSDEQIMEELYGSYSDYIYSIVRNKCQPFKLTEEDIEDCYIDSIIRMCEKGCRKIRQFKGESSFKTFLTVLCRNLATDYIRKETKNRERFRLVDSVNEDWNDIFTLYSDDPLRDNPEKSLLSKERETVIREAREIIEKEIDGLKHEDRVMALLRLKKNMAYREIDEFLGIDNSRYRLLKIFQKIRAGFDGSMRQSIEDLLSGEGIEGRE